MKTLHYISERNSGIMACRVQCHQKGVYKLNIRNDIRNVAIIAHVDHGKTTLVDELLKQSQTLDSHTQLQERAMDSNAIEKERGITILAKIRPLNTMAQKSTSWIPQDTRTSVEKWNES